MAKKEVIEELVIESIGFEGVAVARKDGKVFMIQGGLPGETIRALITKNKKSYSQGFLKEVITPAPERREPICEYFGSCGGCKWQNLIYSEQLKWKKIHVNDALVRLGKFSDVKINEPLASPNEFYYRNKMEFSFGDRRWLTNKEAVDGNEYNKEFALGLHVPQKFDRVIDVKECFIQKTIGNKILEIVRSKALEIGAKPYSFKFHEGLLKSLIIRTNRNADEIMVNLLSTSPKNEIDELFLNWYENEFPKLAPEVTEVIRTENDSKNNVAAGDPIIIKGKGYIRETILGVEYRISPFSFFQTNSDQLDNFIGKIVELSELKSEDVVFDLYCGTGSITFPASKQCKEIYGIEVVESSIYDAKQTAELNEIKNASFFCADLHAKEIPDLLFKLPKPDVIIVDPPRAGMHNNLIEHLLTISAPKLIYVSCNPATQARDLDLLREKYEIIDVTPVDMFPQTYHIESIAVLKLK